MRVIKSKCGSVVIFKIVFKNPSLPGRSLICSLVCLPNARRQSTNVDISAVHEATRIKMLVSFPSVILKAVHREQTEIH